ncbi:MAG: ATP-binding protein [Candidatus Coatesbacteria bacterium]|nr:ATP-binding protein [Candidatus Coatesbacteria bacterium]
MLKSACLLLIDTKVINDKQWFLVLEKEIYMAANLSLAVISSRREVRREIRDIVVSIGSKCGFNLFFILNYADAADILNFEIPELIIADFADPVLSPEKLLEDLKGEPWLQTAGIIGIVEDIQSAQLPSKIPQANVINVIDRRFLSISLPRILKILQSNRQILAQKGIVSSLTSQHSGSFTIDVNNEDFEGYINLLTNYLYQQGIVSLNKSQGLALALYELIMNAIEHGNCRITQQEKSSYLKNNWDAYGLIKEKLQNTEIASKKVHLEYAFYNDRCEFTITDEGEGFDHKTVLENIKEGKIFDKQGRGIYLAKQMVDEIRYSETGNQVTISIKNQSLQEPNSLPEGFINAEVVNYEEGDKVFSYGERGLHLFYIINGSFEVIVKEKVISILTKDDLFFGEMSFLLNYPRTATIKAKTASKVLKIDRQQFFQTLKHYPNYGLFLARMLAKRLAITTKKLSGLADSGELST